MPALILALLGAGTVLWALVAFWPWDGGLRQAELALVRGEYEQAERRARRVLQQAPRASGALLVAGYAAAGQENPDAALDYFRRIPDEAAGEAAQALFECGEQAFRRGQAAAAEKYFQGALARNADHVAAHERLAYLFALQGRAWDGQGHILHLLRAGRTDPHFLIAAGSPDVLLADVSKFKQQCLAAVPDDPLPLLHDAQTAWRSNQLEQAEQLLRKIVAAHPGVLEAQARLGRILAEGGSSEEFLQWHRGLPAAADEHPEIWFVRGLWAQNQNQSGPATRCFWEAAVRHPSHTGANFQLSQMLAAAGQTEQAEPFARRAEQLSELRLVVEGLKGQLEWDTIRQAVHLLVPLGRYWEAAGWCRWVLQHDPPSPWARQTLAQLNQALTPDAPLTVAQANPAGQLDLSRHPLPRWYAAGTDGPAVAVGQPSGQVTFVDVASAAGLDFTYFHGAEEGPEESLFEMNGGGVAVLDYDGDGWPDLVFTQGGPLPPATGPHEFTDRLYRNLGTGQFEEVTLPAGLRNSHYSQGVTVGDFNGDGFPDVYVANIGPNCFYQNNGDGTFSEISLPAGVAGDAWTSSCLMADLDGDGFPEIYAVNYLAGADLFTRQCRKDQSPRCSPVQWPAAQDQLYRNRADGTFEDVTEQSGIVAAEGRGLGIVAADFEGSGRLSLFVANDMSPNFFFANQTPSRGGTLALSERGVLSGLAFDAQGAAQACMGVAVDDANGNGLLDLFVTNFYRESNVLYVQQPDHLFRDETRQAKLRDPGFLMLGWGTQFLDAQLNGYPDLVVANGHVHEPSDQAVPYRMRPQFFQNLGAGRFQELPAQTLGPYFQKPHLGRALARLDWNRDGREDFCVSHLDAPVALLTNQTPVAGRFLAVRLIGVHVEREAIGASVRVTAAGRTWVRQLTAGDGFHASNERQLVFGLGQLEQPIDEVRVDWPNGHRDSFHNIPPDSRLVLIEGGPSTIIKGQAGSRLPQVPAVSTMPTGRIGVTAAPMPPGVGPWGIPAVPCATVLATAPAGS